MMDEPVRAALRLAPSLLERYLPVPLIPQI